MDTTLKSTKFASPLPRPEWIATIAGYAMTVVSILYGVDLRAAAWGGLWLRAVFPVRT